MLDWDHTRAGPVDWVSGACMLVRRSAFDAARGLRPGLFHVRGGRRPVLADGARAGWTVGYEPAGRVVHTVGASSQLAPYRMILAHHRSLLRFANRTTIGPRRVVLPAVAAALGVRTCLAWAHHRFSEGGSPPPTSPEGVPAWRRRAAIRWRPPAAALGRRKHPNRCGLAFGAGRCDFGRRPAEYLRGGHGKGIVKQEGRARRSYRWRTHASGFVVVVVAGAHGRDRGPRHRRCRLLA